MWLLLLLFPLMLISLLFALPATQSKRPLRARGGEEEEGRGERGVEEEEEGWYAIYIYYHPLLARDDDELRYHVVIFRWWRAPISIPREES